MKTPKAHIKHNAGIPCGCWTGQPVRVVTCPYCGASYLVDEVIGFPRWTCYDCGVGMTWMHWLEYVDKSNII